MRVEPLARQLDRCDVCGKKIHRHRLVRTNMRFLQPAGSNYFAYSSYSSSYHSCSASDVSTITIGPHADKSRTRVDTDNTVSYVDGTQTWSGSGTFRTTTSVDVSSLTNFTVSAAIGQQLSWSSNVASASDLTVAMGLCDGDGNNKALQRTFTGVNAMQRLWFTMAVADIESPLSSSGIYVYFTVTIDGTDYWFIDDISLEGDKTSPDQFITTSGTAKTSQTATKKMTMVKVCSSCREPLLLESEQFGRPFEEEEPPIGVDFQEI